MPPSAMRTYLRPVAVAIDWPSDVLPTPGGPTRHRIGAFTLTTRCWTARYSRKRSFTFSRPKWSSSSTRSAFERSLLTLLFLRHGKPIGGAGGGRAAGAAAGGGGGGGGGGS